MIRMILGAWRQVASNDVVSVVRGIQATSLQPGVRWEQSHQVTTERFIRLDVVRQDRTVCDLRTAVNAVYAGGIDPCEFAITVVEDVEQASTGSSPNHSTSTLSCSYAGIDVEDSQEQGDDP